MNLTKVHQIVIAAAAGLAALFTLRSAMLYVRTGAVAELALALAAAVVALGLAGYLRQFRRKLAAK